jgi:hypothetical protein
MHRDDDRDMLKAMAAGGSTARLESLALYRKERLFKTDDEPFVE